MRAESSLRARATRAFAWSFARSWSVKLFSLFVFFVLARLLSPQQFGSAQLVLLVLGFVALLADAGLPAALLRYPDLRPDEAGALFWHSTALAALLGLALALAAAPLTRALGAPEAEPLLRASAFVPPLTAAANWQAALLRRELRFGALARIAVVAGLAAGGIGMALAFAGFGAWALVVQAMTVALLSLALSWHASPWRPSWTWRLPRQPGLLAFSAFALASALVDFFTLRLVDFLLLNRFGAALLGIYSVGAKLYLTLLELLAAALYEVSANLMAGLQQDPQRLRRVHLRLLFLGSCSSSALFVGVAALADEITLLLFGPAWAEVGGVLRLLGLFGAVEVVQYFNGALLLAQGRTQRMFQLGLLKLALTAAAVSLLPAADVGELVLHFVLALACVSPLNFAFARRTSGASWRELADALWPGWSSAVLAFAAVHALRPWLQDASLALQLLLLGLAFALVHVALLMLLRGAELRRELGAIWQARRHG